MDARRGVSTPLGLSLGAVLALPAAAQADDFRVTNLNASGAGSLREAVEDSFERPGSDRILFKSKLSGTIQLEGSDPLFLYDEGGGDLDIVGPGARKLAVRGSGESRIFGAYGEVGFTTPIDISISGLTLTNGNEDLGSGGGINVAGDVDLTLSRTTISGNASGTNGGGITFFGYGPGISQLVMENSTISGNQAVGPGGAVGGAMWLSDVDASVRNSTLSGNVAERAGGFFSIDSEVDVRNSTVARNTATAGYSGGMWTYDTALTFRGSIIAENIAPDFGTDIFPESTDLSAAFTLIGDTTSATIDNDLGGNLLDVDPKLKPLANNGGPTDTHAFKKSPAKNKGPSDAPNQDQRGAPRKGKADIGAYEFTKCKGVIVNRVGTAGKDKLKGTKRKDGILGLGGNDKLSGKKGKDGLCGGQGKDKLKGGPGKDKLNGGPGKDKEVQ